MFKNKTPDGKLNISGVKIASLRCKLPGRVSQKMLADRMALLGIDLDKNAMNRIERGLRFVTDIELKTFAELLNVTTDELLTDDE